MSTVRSDGLSREKKLRKLAKKKKKLQLERDKLDYKIIQTQAEYGALYNETAAILNLPIEIPSGKKKVATLHNIALIAMVALLQPPLYIAPHSIPITLYSTIHI